MKYERFGHKYILRLEKGEEIVESLKTFVEKENIRLASLTGLGATDNAVLGIYKLSDKKYYNINFQEDMEIINLTGNITRMDSKPYLHLHISLGREDFSVVGGHLEKAIISVTSEIIIDTIPGEVNRFLDESIGINLLDL